MIPRAIAWSVVASLIAPCVALAGAPSWVGEGKDSISASLHIHGSMSEGAGSVQTATEGAKLVGTDVVWWSDHDWRIQLYTYVTRASLDQANEPSWRHEAWAPQSNRDNNSAILVTPDQDESDLDDRFEFWSFTYPNEGMAEGDGYCLMGARSLEDGFNEFELEVDTDRRRLIRPLSSGATLSIRIRPDLVSEDAQVFVRVQLSAHEPYEGIPGGAYNLVYILDNDATEPEFNPGNRTLTVPLPFIPGEWTDYTLPLSDDATAGFPHLDARDMSAVWTYLGVRSRDGADAMAGFDDIRMTHLRSGEEMFEIQRSILEDAMLRDPSVVHHQGVEYSYFEHLNIFSEQTTFYDYDQLIAESGLVDDETGFFPLQSMFQYSADRVAEDVHARGGLVSLNHPFGISGSINGVDIEATLEDLDSADVYDVDILEVGYNVRGRPLIDLLWLWDELAKRGVILTGTGVSDAHGGNAQSWRNAAQNNMFTFMYADDTSKPSLIEAMRRGRVYFGEQRLWGGVIDLKTELNEYMGDVVITDRETASVDVFIEPTVPADEISIVIDGETTELIDGDVGSTLRTIPVQLNESGMTLFRVEMRNFGNVPTALTNPIYFTRGVPSRGVDAARVRIDLAGLRSTRVEGVELVTINSEITEIDRTVRMSCLANNGRFEFDLTEFGEPRGVAIDPTLGASATSEIKGQTLTITGLNGRGSVIISSVETSADPCTADCNLSLEVDFADLICILFEFGNTGSAGDADGSGTVDFADLLAALFQFGPCG